MKTLKRTILLTFCVTIVMAMSSCSQKSSKSGCPVWGKAKVEQTRKKSV